MTDTVPSPDPARRKRSVRRLVLCLVGLVVVALGITFGAVAEAKRTYTRAASARQQAHVVVTERSTVKINVWYPARGRSHAQSAFATVTGAASAGGTASRVATRRATATTASKAHAVALSRAKSAARSAARKAAGSIAVSRARAAAHAFAVRQATAQALARAKTRYLTATAPSTPPVKAPPPVTAPARTSPAPAQPRPAPTTPAPNPTTTTVVPDPTTTTPAPDPSTTTITPNPSTITPEPATSGPSTPGPTASGALPTSAAPTTPEPAPSTTAITSGDSGTEPTTTPVPQPTTPAPDPTGSPPPATLPPCGGEVPLAAPMTCTFDDEFSGQSLDTTKWSAVTTATSSFQGGPECYVDTPENISVSGGVLNLTARQASAPFLCHDKLHGDHPTEYSAGSVSSIGKFSQAYGQFSVRAKFPATTVAGLQASLWMWPDNQYKYPVSWPLSGELDIAEEYSYYSNLAIPYLHYGLDATTYNPKDGTNVPTSSCYIAPGEFHEYTANWSAGTITISIDGVRCLTDHYVGLDALGALLPPAAPFDQPFFMILTQGLGVPTPGNTTKPDNRFVPGTTQLPATTSIDYVRVWQAQ